MKKEAAKELKEILEPDEIYLKQKRKISAFEYLVKRGYKVKKYLVSAELCPDALLKPFIYTKRISVYKLFDKNNYEVDQIVALYTAHPNEFENLIDSLF